MLLLKLLVCYWEFGVKMKKVKIVLALILLGFVVFIVGCSNSIESSENDIVLEESNGKEIKVTTDGVKYLVDPSKIVKGVRIPGDVKDAIPSIDNPKYISVEEADKWIKDNELVLALTYKNVERVYPLQILVSHEIVNDFIAGDAILITYCPLCGSGIAYERTINGEVVEFGTSGKLYNSNLVMYDRKTESYWTQIDGDAIVGELTGMELKEISIDTVAWRDWKKLHKDSEVLSRDTGYAKSYGSNPYGGYFEDDFIWFPLENEDTSNRIRPKDVVFGIEIDGKSIAYTENSIISSNGLIEDTFNGVNIKVERSEDGIVKITNLDSGEEIIKERDFWFAWFAFHPESKLYGFD
ncbi:hypothetical protein CL617_05490 [archaeon]|nr:hypothetical protein [archaeon]